MIDPRFNAALLWLKLSNTPNLLIFMEIKAIQLKTAHHSCTSVQDL